MIRPTAKKVKAIDDYKILIEFDNGEIRVFDASLLFNRKAFQAIKERNVFRNVRTNGISIEWLDGIDVCPDELYYSSRPVQNNKKKAKDLNL